MHNCTASPHLAAQVALTERKTGRAPQPEAQRPSAAAVVPTAHAALPKHLAARRDATSREVAAAGEEAEAEAAQPYRAGPAMDASTRPWGHARLASLPARTSSETFLGAGGGRRGGGGRVLGFCGGGALGLRGGMGEGEGLGDGGAGDGGGPGVGGPGEGG